MKNYQLVFVLLVAGCIVPSWSAAADKVVVIPLFKNSKIAGDATPADVVKGKTFTSADGEHTGIRPPAPIGTDYVGKGVQPPDPRFQVYRGPFTAEIQTGYGVKDKMTGLIWRLSPEPDNTYFQAKEYCMDMSTQYFPGKGRPISVEDWRLPTVKELESLLDYGRGTVHISGDHALARPNFFTNVQPGDYWTNTMTMVPCPGGGGSRCNIVYTVDIDGATVHKAMLSGGQGDPQYSFLCVRGPYGIDY